VSRVWSKKRSSLQGEEVNGSKEHNEKGRSGSADKAREIFIYYIQIYIHIYIYIYIPHTNVSTKARTSLWELSTQNLLRLSTILALP